MSTYDETTCLGQSARTRGTLAYVTQRAAFRPSVASQLLRSVEYSTTPYSCRWMAQLLIEGPRSASQWRPTRVRTAALGLGHS